MPIKLSTHTLGDKGMLYADMKRGFDAIKGNGLLPDASGTSAMTAGAHIPCRVRK